MMKIEVKYFDVYYMYYMNNKHDFLTVGYRERILAAIHADGDFNDIEMYEIMMQPVIYLQPINKQKSSIFLLRYFCLSCVGKCKFLNLFTGKNWQFYIVKL